jgi:hypothetical protein
MASLALAGSARADIPFSFQENGTGDLGTSGPTGNGTFIESGLTITAQSITGVVVANQVSVNHQYDHLSNEGSASTVHLYSKVTSGDPSETGLGLANDPEHEVLYGNGILLDFSQVKANQPFTISFGSVQHSSGDVAAVYDYSTGKLVSTFDTNGNASITIGPGATDFQYLFTEANAQGNNVLLTSVTIASSAAPEPSTMVIAGLGAIGFIGYGLRRRKARTA